MYCGDQLSRAKYFAKLFYLLRVFLSLGKLMLVMMKIRMGMSVMLDKLVLVFACYVNNRMAKPICDDI